MMRTLPLLLLGWLFALPLQAEPVRIATSILPHAGIAERIGGEHVEVIVLAGEGADPHSFQPSPKQVVEISESACFFACDMPFEEGLVEKLEGIKNGPRVIHLTKGVDLSAWGEDDHDHDHHHHHGEHEHGEEHKDGEEGEHHDHHHDHGEFDPHVWLAPLLLEVQAQAITSALSEVDPDNAAAYRKNMEALSAELYALDSDLADQLAPLKDSTLYVFHAAFGYFASAYGLEQKAVQMGGKEPTPKQLVELIEQARKDEVKMIFVQPQFSQRSAKKIAQEIGAEVVPLDPLAKDVLANLREIGKAVEASR